MSTDDVRTSHVIMRVLVRPITGRRPNPRYIEYLLSVKRFFRETGTDSAHGAGTLRRV